MGVGQPAIEQRKLLCVGVKAGVVVDCDAMLAQRGNGAFEVDGVPKDDGSDKEVEAPRPGGQC